MLALGFAFLFENTFFFHTTREYNKANLLRLLPSIFVQTFKMICSSFFSKNKNKSMFPHLFLLAIIYEIVACIATFNAYKISGIYNAVAASAKFPFISLFSYIMLKKRYTHIQIFGQLIIFGGIFYGAICNDKKIEQDEMTAFAFIFCFCVMVISSVFASFGTVYFEKYIKSNIIDFNTYIMDYSAVHIFVSMCSSFFEIIKIGDLGKFESTISNSKFYICIIVVVTHTYIITYISMKIGPITRSFLFLVINNISSIIITYKEDKIIKMKALVSLFVVNIGICFYEMHKLKKIWQNIINKQRDTDRK